MPSQTISVVEGSNITLPCNVERPFLNNYTVRWTANGEELSPLPPGLFDLQLTDVVSPSNYKCCVETRINQPMTGADAVATIILTVTPQHSTLH